MGSFRFHGRVRAWASLFAAIALLERWSTARPGFVGPATPATPKLRQSRFAAGVDTLPKQREAMEEEAMLLAPGDSVIAQGLQSEAGKAMNGATGVVQTFDPQSGRYQVDFADFGQQALKPSNLRRASIAQGTEEKPESLNAEPSKEEPANLFLGAGAGLLATGTVSVLGPLLVKSGLLAPLKEAVTSLATPLSESYAIPLMTFGIPNWLLHWSHGGNTGSALVLIAGAGVAAGLDIRRRRLEKQPPPGPQVVDHSTLMISALVIALVGASGGLASMRYDQQPLLESPHAWAATLSVMLLVANALVSTTFSGAKKATGSGPSPRDLHAQLGSAWIASVAVSAVMGLSLGTSYEGLTSVDSNQASQPIPGTYFYGGQAYDPRLQLTQPEREP